MVTVVVDGYNVIHAVPELARQLDRSLKAAREALVSLCQAYQTRRGDIQRVYVVFDGDQAYARGPQTDRGGVTVLFTQRQEEADDRILGLIRADEGRTRFIIVSNDLYVFNNARAHGTGVLSVSEFFAQLRPARAPRLEHPDVVDKATPSAREAHQITADYRNYLENRSRPKSLTQETKLENEKLMDRYEEVRKQNPDRKWTDPLDLYHKVHYDLDLGEESPSPPSKASEAAGAQETSEDSHESDDLNVPVDEGGVTDFHHIA